jgi:hypothetical protein
MNILNKNKFNEYFKVLFLIFSLLSLSLIPWVEFININFSELNFIFNDNLIFLLVSYFLFIILIYIILKSLINLEKYSLVSFISISIWIFFQHNFVKSKINVLLKNIRISNEYSSELALIVILSLIYLFFLLNKKKFYTNFLLFFLMFNLLFSTIQFATKYFSQKKINSFEEQRSNLINNIIKKPNIYFFILDGMMPLNEFNDYYKINLNDFVNYYNRQNYIYYKNTTNFYGDTAESLTSLFFLEKIFIEDNNYQNENLKSNIYAKFPTLLNPKYNPRLISELNKLGYEFKWIGNSYASCSKYNYRYCLSNKKEEYIDLYLLQVFLEKTPLMQIFNKLTEIGIVQKYFKINQQGDAMGKLQKFLISNNDYIKSKSTFYFVHHIHPHWPYKHDEQCNYKNFPGNTNFEGYKNSYLCVIKNVTNTIKIIEQLDSDAMVIFQSDHSWEMSKISESKYGNRRKIFNLVKNNFPCNKTTPAGLNNVQMTNYLIGCLKNN